MVGPNCLGVLSTDPAVSLNATYAGARVAPGRLAISSQSGALGISLLGHAAARGLGVASFASLGSRADVSTNDLLELWEEDARTAAVMLYLEAFGNPDRFARIAQRVSRRKPILAVTGRRPQRGHGDARLAHRGGAAARRGGRRPAAPCGRAALPQRRGPLRRGAVLREPAAAAAGAAWRS